MSRHLPASVRARLKQRADALREDFNLTLTRYGLERLLYRLSISPHAERYLLKGALLFSLWFDQPHRPTRDVDLLALPVGARLRLGERAVLELTGLRNPCQQLDGLRPGLMQAVLRRDAAGGLVRLAGVMAVVLAGGTVRVGDGIRVELPAGEPRALTPV